MEKLNNNLKRIGTCADDIISLQSQQLKAVNELDSEAIDEISKMTDDKMVNLAELSGETISILGGSDINERYPELAGIKKKIRKSIDHVQRNNIELQVKLMASSNTINSILVASGVIERKSTYSRDLK